MEKIKEKQDQVDVVIVGTGVAGLFAALNLPRDFKIMMITKADLESSDSFLAQGGICVLRDESDYDSYFEDTMRAGHYENRKESVDIMIRSSQEIIRELIGYGVEFERRTEHSDDVIGDSDISRTYEYTREGAHSSPRILFHEDITGKEITGKLLARVKELDNVEIFEYTTMTDIIEEGGVCRGVVMQEQDGTSRAVRSAYTIVASGGIGGLYRHSTNFPHLTGDALEIAKKHGIRLEHTDYVQIHPTTLYSKKPGRRFLISESVRGEGAVLLDKEGNRFVNELLPRDVVTKAIREQMEKDGTDHVWLSMENIGTESILSHFPNIYRRCKEEGYDVTAVELVKYNLGILKKKNSSVKAYQGNALKLSRFPDKEFDLIILFGPMYHLYTKEDKVKALMEAKRVLKDEGTILVAYTMNEYSVLVYGFRENHIQECLENGKLDANYRVCPSPEDLYDYVRLEDIDSYNEAAGMERIQIISADGPSDYMRQVLNTMDEKTFQTFIDYHLTTCERPELVGAGSHTVDIIRKKKDGGIENESSRYAL